MAVGKKPWARYAARGCFETPAPGFPLLNLSKNVRKVVGRRGPKKDERRVRICPSVLAETAALLREVKEARKLPSLGHAIDWAAPTIRRRLAATGREGGRESGVSQP